VRRIDASIHEPRGGIPSVDEKLVVALFDRVRDRQFSVSAAIALFGNVEDRGDRVWRVTPKPELGGVEQVRFRFFDPRKAAPEDVELVLASPWETTTTRLTALFGAPVRWSPAGPGLGRNRTVSIHRAPDDGRREGVTQFELDHRGGEVEELKIILVRFRPLGP
jgi:hypothetical protein